MLLFGSAKYGLLSAAEYSTQLRDPSKPALEYALKKSLWQDLAQSPQMEKHFAHYMTILPNKAMPGIVQNIKLSESGVVADVGGGYGHTLLEFLKTNPKLTGIVYEQPTVCRLVEAGFNNPNPPSDSIYSKYSADVQSSVHCLWQLYRWHSAKTNRQCRRVLFKWVFHNNNDAVCSKILAGLYHVMKPGAKIIKCDCVFKDTPHEWTFQDTMDLCKYV